MRALYLLSALVPALVAVSSPVLAQGDGQAVHFLEQWDADADGKVTLEEARSKRGEVFYMFDSDEDGTLNPDEWALVADHMQAEMDLKSEMRPAKGQGQGQGQGKGMNGPGQAMHAAMSPAFNDADGNGVVTEAEFVAATDTLFTNLDRNADGVVSAADFAR